MGPPWARLPASKAGDYIDLRAEMDLLCGLTACSAEGSNNGCLKPIDFVILEPARTWGRTHSASLRERPALRSEGFCRFG